MKRIVWFGNSKTPYEELVSLRSILLDMVIVNCYQFFFCEQVHSDRVAVVDESHKSLQRRREGFELLTGVDALVTKMKNVFLAVKTADCVPVLLHDSVKGVTAAIHSGRIGTKKI